MIIALTNKVLDEIRNHAEEEYPNECCGFFFGRDDEIRRVTQIDRTENIQTENRKRRFRIDPSEYLRAEKFADDQDLDFLGIYHSHPDHPAVPSEHDRSVAMPYFSYIIVSVREGNAQVIRSWRLNEEEKFDEEELEILTEQETISLTKRTD